MSLSDDLAYEVKWFFTRLRGGPAPIQVASVDRFGVVRKINRNSSSDVTIERKDTHIYLLNIFGTQDRWGANKWFVCLISSGWETCTTPWPSSQQPVSSVVSSDSGEYFCSVTPWYLSASTGAWTEAQELTSSKVFLAVKFAGVVQKTRSYFITWTHLNIKVYDTPALFCYT